MVLVITLPAMVALLCVPDIFIRILFEHGAFTARDTQATVLALMAYAAGLPAYVLLKVFTPGFFARGDTKTPVRVSIGCLALNTGLGIALMGPLAHAGLALATAAAAWVNAGLLCWILIRRGHLRVSSDVLGRCARMVLAALAMAGALYGLSAALEVPLGRAPWIALPTLIAVSLAGMAFYAGFGSVLGAFRLTRIKQAFRRRKAPPPQPSS
jgi:putative peptidoglycan lipid II flippase